MPYFWKPIFNVVVSCFVSTCCSGFLAQPEIPNKLLRLAVRSVYFSHEEWIEMFIVVVLPVNPKRSK
ncbi:AgrD family cyclic lactone autoinducer peptide [Acinetobacter junii]|uniref:AgrD family cyclic lactone autoinducer peptide n=1 Tax=Acinetobacter junii TaxID=40215 RepID=UPI0039A18DE3